MIDARSPAPAAPNTLCYVPGNVDQKDKNPVSVGTSVAVRFSLYILIN